MGELYSWFLNAARLGLKMLDALARAAIRFVSYPASILYNIGLSAYSSFATGRYMQDNPLATINDIINRYNGDTPSLGKSYNYYEMVNFFPTLIDGPYSARGVIVGGDESDATFHTIDTPISINQNLSYITDIADKLAKDMSYFEQRGYNEFRLQFILGTPRIIPMR